MTEVGGAPTAIAFVQGPPATVASGIAFSPAVTVRATDQFGNPSSGVSVTMALNGGGTLTGGGAQTTAAGTGIATFSGLSVNLVGTGKSLTANVASPVLSTTSSTFDVIPGAIDHYVVSATTPQTRGAPFNVSITAQDVNNNTVTTDSSTVVTLSASSANVLYDGGADSSFSDNTVTLSGGTATVSAKDNFAETVTLTATDAGANTGTSANVVITPLTGDFISRASGNWNVTGTWSNWTGSGWINATTTPGGGAGTNITIQSAHLVTNNVVVNLSGALVVNGTLRFSGVGVITNNSGGIIENAGTVTSSATTLIFNSGSTYQHNFTTSAGTVPTAKWNAGSTCDIIGYTTDTTAPTGLTQAFANFTWNCPKQSGTFNLGGTLQTNTGNFTLVSTGTGILVGNTTGGNSGSYTLTIGGDMIIQGGTFNFANATSGTGTPTFALNLGGSYNQTGGTFTYTESETLLPVFFTGANATFTQSGGTFTSTLMNFSVNSGATLTLNNDFPVASGDVFTNIGTLNCGVSAISGAGTFTNLSGATLGIGSSAGITSSGATGNIQTTTRRFSTGGNYAYNGTNDQATGNGLPATVNNLTISNTGPATVTLSANVAVSGALNVQSGTFDANGKTVTVTGLTTVSGGTYLASTATQTLTGGLTVSGGAFTGSSGTVAVGNVTLISGTLTAPSGPFNVSGNWLNNGGTLVTGSGTVSFSGSGAQSIGGSASTTFNNLAHSGSGTTTQAINTSVAGDLSVSAGTFDVSTFTADRAAGGGTLTVANGATLLVGGAANFPANYSTVSLGATSTVNYDNAGDQTIALQTYGNLTVSGSGNKTSSDGTVVAGTLTFNGGATPVTLIQPGTSSLTVNGAVTINQPTASATNTWNIGAGTATVSGLITFAGNNTTTTRVGTIIITTGTLNANGGITFVGSAAATKVINMSGGAGNLNLKGALTVPALSSTLTAGSAGSVFNYADSAAQTVSNFTAGAYNILHFNNTAGVTLGAAVTSANVAGDVSVQTGTFGNGGFGITLASGKNFSVANGATFNLTGTSTMVSVSGGGTKTFGATSLVNYAGTAQTVTAESYGNLTLSGSGIKTLPGTPLTVVGNFAMSGTATATTAANVTVAGNASIGSGAALTAGNNLSVTGTTTVDGTNTLSGNNTFTGGVTLDATGRLNLNSATALGGSTLTIAGGTLGNTSAGAVTLSPDSPQNWNGDFTFAGTQNLDLGSGAATLGANRIVTVSANTLTVDGVIGGAFNLTKAGTGTLTLTGNNTFSGTLTVQAGTLSVPTVNDINVAGTLGQSANAVILGGVAAGGTLQYTGGTAGTSKPFGIDTNAVIRVSTAATVLTINGEVYQVNNGTLTNAGPGTLVLAGTDDNNSLGVIVSGGTNVLAKTSNTGVHAIGGPGLTIGGGTVQLGGTGGDQIYDFSTETVNSGTFDFNGRSEVFTTLGGTGGTILNNGGAPSTLTWV